MGWDALRRGLRGPLKGGSFRLPDRQRLCHARPQAAGRSVAALPPSVGWDALRRGLRGPLKGGSFRLPDRQRLCHAQSQAAGRSVAALPPSVGWDALRRGLRGPLKGGSLRPPRPSATLPRTAAGGAGRSLRSLPRWPAWPPKAGFNVVSDSAQHFGAGSSSAKSRAQKGLEEVRVRGIAVRKAASTPTRPTWQGGTKSLLHPRWRGDAPNSDLLQASADPQRPRHSLINNSEARSEARIGLRTRAGDQDSSRSGEQIAPSASGRGHPRQRAERKKGWRRSEFGVSPYEKQLRRPPDRHGSEVPRAFCTPDGEATPRTRTTSRPARTPNVHDTASSTTSSTPTRPTWQRGTKSLLHPRWRGDAPSSDHLQASADPQRPRHSLINNFEARREARLGLRTRAGDQDSSWSGSRGCSISVRRRRRSPSTSRARSPAS
ncbi:hypothetical protein ENSA5_66090 [Enhygromyxa salina]|uniref:Uncharacterized protein n=1 Tax=Enhygromyxa salina TaxID=215803 RepID=A0A2S9XBN9_9BACT|nr:hypothetical protein ENSA5_66090 [Enhygromyxa salina]